MKFILSLPFLALLYALLYYFFVPVQDLQRLYPTWVRNPEEDTAKELAYKVELVQKRPPNYLSLQEIPAFVQRVFILSEDGGFYSHSGVDFAEIAHSLRQAIKRKRRPRGASTISQQLIKNIYFSKRRSWWRKFNELILTIKLERNLKKTKILELYFNIVEMSPGVYGLARGAQFYFHKNPRELNLQEAAYLAALLRNPKKAGSAFHQRYLRILLRRVHRHFSFVNLTGKIQA